MKARIIILLVLVSLCLPACMKEGMGKYGMKPLRIEGIVVDDSDETPINHIRITIEWDSEDSPAIIYSSGSGKFESVIDIPDEYPMTIDLTLSDIDGEDNGGLYEERTDQISIIEGNDSKKPSTLVYRMTRATASESSLLSL